MKKFIVALGILLCANVAVEVFTFAYTLSRIASPDVVYFRAYGLDILTGAAFSALVVFSLWRNQRESAAPQKQSSTVNATRTFGLCMACFVGGSLLGSLYAALWAHSQMKSSMGIFSGLFDSVAPSSSFIQAMTLPAMWNCLEWGVAATLIFAATRGGRFLFASASRASDHAETSDRG